MTSGLMSVSGDPMSGGARLDPFDLSLSLPLVGRTRELILIARLIDDTSHGRGGVLLVSGDGGIGKTRLIIDATRPARDAKWLTAANC